MSTLQRTGFSPLSNTISKALRLVFDITAKLRASNKFLGKPKLSFPRTSPGFRPVILEADLLNSVTIPLLSTIITPLFELPVMMLFTRRCFIKLLRNSNSF
ncbi:hypothetical protein D3C71_1379900 [compost metagenome]